MRILSIGALITLAVVLVSFTLKTETMESKGKTKAYLEITLNIKPENRAAAAEIYVKYKSPFLKQIQGATSKGLLLRTKDVQVLHGFTSEENAANYLSSELFENDVVRELKPYLEGAPEIRIYSVFSN